MKVVQDNIFDNFKRFFNEKSMLSKLILINIAVWLLCLITGIFTWLFNVNDISFFSQWFAVPANLSKLLVKPWTLFTYMFLQEGFWHLFFNMMMLYFGGKLFLQLFSEKQLLLTYIVGGIVGALVFILAYNVFPVFESSRYSAIALGSSASVLSILIAAATYRPEYKINLFLFGEVKMKWIAIIFVLIDVLSIPKGNAGGHFSHLGGALWGFLYVYFLKNNKDLYDIFKDRKKIKVKSRNFNTNSQRPKTDEQYNAERAADQEETDRILEKIAKKGYSSLSDKEKEYLFRQSKK